MADIRNHIEMFGSNSLRYPERATGSTSSPRTSFPKFNYQKALAIFGVALRQPLIIPTVGRVVKAIAAQIDRARYLTTPGNPPKPPRESRPNRPAQNHQRSGGALIITLRSVTRNPLKHNSLHATACFRKARHRTVRPDRIPQKKRDPAKPPGSLNVRRSVRRPTQRPLPTSGPRSLLRRRPAVPAPRTRRCVYRSANPRLNGPCRNRTYNLAIKSRLLCQLS